MSDKFCNLSLEELRCELRKRNAKVTGRKKELIERLQAYDRNDNFSSSSKMSEPEYHMSLPDMSKYLDLHSEKKFVNVDMPKIENFLRMFDTRMDDTALNLYHEKYLCYLRVCVSDDHDSVFVRSACRAEMKKSVSYIVDVSLTKDGYINEAQCECAAGMGPNAHCKHVRTVLYACHKFSMVGEFKVEQTCTEKLQTFHRVRKFTGSPLKARDINMPGAGEFANSDFDPRPPQFRNAPWYNDYFRNVCLNTRGVSKMPIFQLFKPANALALAHDHDYFELTHEDNFLRQLHVEEITQSEAVAIEKDTRGQSVNDRWHIERQRRIQSSNFGRICKATDKTDFSKLASSFVNKKQCVKSEAILHGLKYESEAIAQYEKRYNYKVRPCGLFVSQSVPYIGSSPDGIINQDLIIEVKCPFSAKNKPINSQTVPYLKIENGNLSLCTQHNYYYQVQGQLYCTGRTTCDFVVYTICDLKCLRITRDDQFISNMLDKLQHFYNEHFKPALLQKFFYKDLN